MDHSASVRRKGLAVPIPIVAEGPIDFQHFGDPDLVYETWQGTTKLVGVHLRLDGSERREPWTRGKETIRAMRVSASDSPVSLEDFDALQLVEITRGPSDDARGVDAWLARLPRNLQYLILPDAAGVNLLDVPPHLLHLQIGFVAGAEAEFEHLPRMSSLEWLRVDVHRDPSDHGILGLDRGLFAEGLDDEPEPAEAAESEPRPVPALLLASFGRFPSLRSLDLAVGDASKLEFTAQLPELVRLVIRGGGELELDDLVDHPRLEELEVVGNRGWRVPVRANTRIRRVMLRGGRANDGAVRAAFPNAMILATPRDHFHYATHCADEWFIRPARRAPQPEHEPRGLRVPPVTVVRDAEQLARLSSKLELGSMVAGKHTMAGEYPMVDFYRSGRLLGFISVDGAACESVYLPGEGLVQLMNDASVELCHLLTEAKTR